MLEHDEAALAEGGGVRLLLEVRASRKRTLRAVRDEMRRIARMADEEAVEQMASLQRPLDLYPELRDVPLVELEAWPTRVAEWV